MTKWIALAAVIGLAACAGQPVTPVSPPEPTCVKPDEEEPIDGGLGGTGNTLPVCED
ncbi:MAG: hypothetical protein ACFB03_16260 [Paracoccaceae bacterium]